MPISRSIPRSIKRKVRRSCGFGCIICGHPIFEYDHIVPFSKVKAHTVDNICCLCPNHHSEKTRNQIHIDKIRKARDKPFNIFGTNIYSHPFFFFGYQCCIQLGSYYNYYVPGKFNGKKYEFTPLVIANESIVNVSFGPDDVLLIDMSVKDEDDQIVVSIIENELIFLLDFWDIEFIGRRFTIRDNERSIFFEMIMNMPSHINIIRASFWNNKSHLLIRDNNIFTRYGNQISGGESVNARYGIVYNSREDMAPSGLFVTDW